MLRIYTISFFILGFLISSISAYSQSSSRKQLELQALFIENNGQYEGKNWNSQKEIHFAYHQNPFYIFFNTKGMTYRLDKIVKNPARKKDPKVLPKRTNISELIDIEWLGSNDDVEILAEGKESYDYHFMQRTEEGKRNYKQINAAAYHKITYKNLYDNIDVEYLLHPEGGVKYNIILHPGADPNQIRLKYSSAHTNVGDEKIEVTLDKNGELVIKTSLADIVEHAPISFYADNKGNKLNSSYSFKNNVLSFNIANYDSSKKVIIDPWVISPNFNTSTAVWEVENDALNNTYAIGGETPMELRKYNNLGVQQWVYVTPWDTSSVWLGTLATNSLGESFVTSGVTAEMHKVSAAGNFVWSTAPSGGLEFNSEWWSITFNCDETKLIVGGTWVQGILSFDFYAGIFEIDVATGAVLSDQTVDYTNIGGFGATPVEVRAISSSKNAKYIFLTHHDVGAINQNLSQCPSNEPLFQVDNQDNLAYKCENYLPQTQNGGGLKALVANDNFFYTHSGSEIRQWDLANGNLISTVSLPGGNSNTDFFGDIVVHCSGLDVDDCGNVYAGSTNGVVKYDANLNQIGISATSFAVYDVSVNSNGEILACGAQQNNASTNRSGRIESIGLTACSQYTLVCCDANFCQVGPLCTTDAPINLSPATGGGTWAGTGVDASGNFDPALAGVGTHTISYTLACGSESIDIVVNNCSPLSVCVETNGDLTVTGGTGPYDWEEWSSGGTTPITNQTECQNCGGTWTFGACYNPFPIPLNNCSTPAGWVYMGSGSTYTPSAGADTVQVTDNSGTVVTYFDISTLPPCNAACDATITPTGPFCQNDPPVILNAAQTGGTWSGTGITNGSTGEFDPSAAGAGSHSVQYTLACGDTDTETIVVNALDNPSFSYAQASYCTSDPNPIPTITGLSGGSFSIDNGGTINSSTGEIDITASGTGTYTIDYTTNGPCPNNGTFVLTITSGADATITPSGPYCENDAAILLSAVDGGGAWTGTGITNGSTGEFDPATAGAGSHVITYQISGSCGDTDTETIIVNALDDASFSYAQGSYCSGDPNPTPAITGLTGGSFSIDNGGTINPGTGEIDIALSGTGTYNITYSTNGSCPNMSIVTITITSGADATISSVGPFCENDPTVILNAVDGGGTWTGTGITNGSTGEFDPGTAGAGSHVISYAISGSCGDTDTETIIVNSLDDATFSYSQASFCATDPNPTPTLTGLSGGSFSIDNGGSINPSTGEIDINASGTGSFNISYTTNGPCPNSSTVSIIITTGADASISPAGPYCENDPIVTLNAVDPGGTWTGTGIINGTTGEFDPVTAGPGSHIISYQISGSCGDTDTETIIVNAQEDASFNYSSSTFCVGDPNPIASVTGTTGGNFVIDNGGTINLTSGEIDIAASGVGTFIISYSTSGLCPDTQTFSVTISNGFDATISPSGPFCENDPAITLSGNDPGGVWSGNGITNPSTGEFDPSVAGAGSHNISYTISGSCGDSDTQTIIVNSSDDPSFSYTASNYCLSDPNPNATVSGLTGGTFTISNGGSINASTGEIDLNLSGLGSYTVYYTTNGPCPSMDSTTIIISDQMDATIDPAGPFCQTDPNFTFSSQNGGGSWSGPGMNSVTGEFNPALAGPGTWDIIYSIPGSCGDADTIQVTVNPIPNADAGIDTTIYLGESTVLDGSGGGSYQWSPPTGLSCTNCQNPISSPNSTTVYTVIVTDNNGCQSQANVTVFVIEEDQEIFVPNIFSPNGDGNNDVLFIKGSNLNEFNLMVYNRWGELVYQSEDQSEGWDGTQNGKPLNNAVFVYVITYNDINGNEQVLNGNVTLMK
jgi:gliding motility-associated-like protein